MTSAWKEPPGRDDRAEGSDSVPDENQLEMFDAATHAGGREKRLLGAAVAAPTAYFIANWTQFPGTAEPSDVAAISDSAAISGPATMLSEERVAAVVPGLGRPTPKAAPVGDEIPGEPTVKRGILPVETSPEGPADATAPHPNAPPDRPPPLPLPPTPP